ncbi:hypothetical protein E3N88_24941 [Mikania micrantha]|uniref:1-phosphatidylinositol 4-kinase n=1 Tax=Mikania micrantha TaxID=192012 RepID=A0A5N6N4L9_9ASTR|nr:hypothetical protein E3N88_24941 [Mikania micrantha]
MSVADVALTPILRRSGSGCFRSSESIVIYLTVAGSVIPMRIMESDSIATVKHRIQTCNGCLIKKQKLFFGGRELSRNNSLIKDYGVSNGNFLHLVLRVSDLVVITVETTIGKEFEVEVDRFRNVRYLKQLVLEKAKGVGFIDAIEDHEVLCDGVNLDDHRLIDDVCNNHDGVIHLVVKRSTDIHPHEMILKKPPDIDSDSPLQPIVVNPRARLTPMVRGMLDSTFDGLKRGKKPIRSSEGTDHPKGGPRVCGDSEMGFAGVPPTVMVKCLNGEFNHPKGYDGGPGNVKVGSLQMFMKNCGSCEDMGPRDFPVEEVHKITVFDIRTANADRHAGNILMHHERGRVVLIPIDHGYCLPENFEDCTFDWLYWPQAREPYSPTTLDYIQSLDAERDLTLLSSNGWDLSRECARTLRISTMLLKKGAKRGLCPYTIGRVLCRETFHEESTIEKILQKASNTRLPGTTEGEFIAIVSDLLDFELDKERCRQRGKVFVVIRGCWRGEVIVRKERKLVIKEDWRGKVARGVVGIEKIAKGAVRQTVPQPQRPSLYI